jgi:Protein of unknown function (DUF1257)
MSHYVNIVTQIKDQKALIKALGRLGFDKGKIEVYETPQSLCGYQNDVRPEKAHVILRKKFVGSSSNDIGFERQADGRYAAHISEFDQGTGSYAGHEGVYGKTWQGKLSAYYGVELAKSEYDKKGLKYFEDVDDKEQPRLRIKM